MTQFDKEWLLSRAAERASSRPEFTGYLFALYSNANGLHRSSLAQELGCSQKSVIQMSLCLRPGKGNRNFSDDIHSISARFSADPARLANLIRLAESLEAFQELPAQSLLMAAREWEQDSEEDESDNRDG